MWSHPSSLVSIANLQLYFEKQKVVLLQGIRLYTILYTTLNKQKTKNKNKNYTKKGDKRQNWDTRSNGDTPTLIKYLQ